MRKKAAAMLCAALAVTSLMAVESNIEKRAVVASGTENPTEAAEKTGETADAAKSAEGERTEGELALGLAVSADLSGSSDAGAEDGAASAEFALAAVTVDHEGKVVSCVIDQLQVSVPFDAKGQLTGDPATEYPTKNERGAAYGMKAASSIGKEWDEQAAAFADYCVGKTAEEIQNIAVTEQGKAEDTDLAASCTVYFGGFQSIVTKAMENAAKSGAQAGDRIGLGVVTSTSNSKSAAADAEGMAEIATTVSAVTVGSDGKITGAVIDAVQATVNFDGAGKLVSDVQAGVQTKNELGEAYGMKVASSIGKEWNEQAAAYAEYAVGKTAEEVNGTAVTEGVPSEADLASSVTLHIYDFNEVLTKAVDSAK